MSQFLYRLIVFVALMVGLPRPDSYGATSTRRASDAAGDLQNPAKQQPEQRHEVVFLLHGIGKGRTDMLALQSMLSRQGYDTVNWRYPSTKLSLDEIADMLNAEVQKYGDRRVSFVTHSMGGIVVRTYLNKYKPAHMGRFVMIAPPNQGAYLADLLGNWLPYKLILGPAGQQLRQGESGKCACAGVPGCEFGIIAGGTGKKSGMNPLVPGDNDGTVSVESTKLDGARDFLLLPYAHPLIQLMPRTGRNVISFLKNGTFAEHNQTRADVAAEDALTSTMETLRAAGQ
jgi:triacylglycerol esterase/lipase EstA (alpha/beta hydrolase family)